MTDQQPAREGHIDDPGKSARAEAGLPVVPSFDGFRAVDDLNFYVDGFWDAVVGAIIISIVSMFANFAIGPRIRRA